MIVTSTRKHFFAIAVAVAIIPLYASLRADDIQAGSTRVAIPSMFVGYYTRLPFDDDRHTGKYADVIVNLPGNGQFVFSREYSYQPYWLPNGGSRYLVERVIPRSGDGPPERPDKINKCSDARIVEQTSGFIKVHWRYAPDITRESFTDFRSAYNRAGNISPFFAEYADEYFSIRPDGMVTRQVKRGCYKLDDWNDPLNVITQTLRLTPDGIDRFDYTDAVVQNLPGAAISGETIKTGNAPGAVVRFSFDEGSGPNRMTSRETISNTDCVIKGVDAYWRKGVSGTCLSFDSYSSCVVLPSAKCPLVAGGMTAEAWIAPQEYPFNWAAIIDHRSGDTGYTLTMGPRGEIGFHVGVGRTWRGVVTKPVPLYRWCHIAAVYDSTRGMAVFIDGTLAAEDGRTGRIDDAAQTDLFIGMTHSVEQYPAEAERLITKGFKTQMVFSGLIDEIRIYNRPLNGDEISSQYRTWKPATIRPLQLWVLPAGPEQSSGFKARFTRLEYNPEWDGLWRVGDYPDVIVTFDDAPWRIVSWRGTRLLPSLVTGSGYDAIWNSDQSPENNKNHSCHEHMSDMLNRYVQVRIVEDSDARKVIHWRNASVNIAYEWPELDADGWGMWTDEYWTIYPDGVAVRYQINENSTPARITAEMNQNELLHQPGQTTEDLLPDGAITVANTDGETQTWYHSRPVPSNPLTGDGRGNLQYMNLKGTTRHFEIAEAGGGWVESFLHFPEWPAFWTGWNHYPVQLIPSDGTVAVQYDRPVSTCTTTLHEIRRRIDDSHLEAMNLYGLTRDSVTALTPLNRSWNFAPTVSAMSGCIGSGYEKRERAFLFTRQEKEMTFTIKASDINPLYNPAFVIRNWNDGTEAVLKVNGVQWNPGPDFRRGVIIDTDGASTLVVWMRYSSVVKTEFGITQE
jgi:hypothetical protein